MRQSGLFKSRARLVIVVVVSAIIVATGLLWGGGQSLSWAAPGQNPHLQTVPPRPPTSVPRPTAAPPQEPTGGGGSGSSGQPAGEAVPPIGDVPLALAPFPGAVIINEIGWGGTAADAADQWIELFNPTDQPISLAGWVLVAVDGEPTVALSGVINAGGYFLLERPSDDTVSDILADLIFTAPLDEAGEILQLLDGAEVVIDTANLDGDPWLAGSSGPGHYSMERVDAFLPDAPANWASNNGVIHNGLDAQGDPLNGTPRQPNSNTLASLDATWAPTGTPASTSPLPTPTASPTVAPSPSPSATLDSSAVQGGSQTSAPSDVAAVSADDDDEDQLPEAGAAAARSGPAFWLIALGGGLVLALGGVFLLRRS